MAFLQTFTYAYSVTLGTNGAITLTASNPRGPVTVSDTADATADNTSRLGDVGNDIVSVTGLNNKTSTYYGSATVGGTPGFILSDQNGKWVFLTNRQFTADTGGTAVQNGACRRRPRAWRWPATPAPPRRTAPPQSPPSKAQPCPARRSR